MSGKMQPMRGMGKRVVVWSTGTLLSLWIGAGAQAVPTSEGFENGSKTAYAGASVNFSSGAWYLQDSLVGTSTSDRKTGTRSVRLQNYGYAEMLFDKAGGAGTITVKHAKYGSDGTTTWALFCSTNGGSSWQQIGSTVTTASTSLQTATFNANLSGAVRCSIDKQDGTSARLNIDDVYIGDYSTSTTPSGSVHLLMGNPSGATTSTANANNYLMDKPQYALSYNNAKKIPNWVSWQLSSAWLGSTPRQDDFRPDTTLPSGWYRVTSSDYSGSGFDRGHMAPSADRTNSVADNSATFLMTNMVPQAPDNNQGPWAKLEDYARTLVGQGNELYIVAGVYGECGSGANGNRCTLNPTSGVSISVPNRTWKAILVVPNGSGSALNRVNTNTRVIAVDMPNSQGIRNNDWRNYRVSVDQIEARTGYDLFSNLPVSIQSVIEARVDNQ